MVETASLIGPNHILQVEALGFLFKSGMQRLGAKIRAVAARIIGAPLVRTDENMSFER
jgi:hypothetical protein